MFTDQWFEAQPVKSGRRRCPSNEDLLISGLRPNPPREQWAPQMPSI
jgi:hypothetical protein